MNPSVLTFHPNGTGTCLYTELIELNAIGPLEIHRASTIEFNNEQQVWEVKDLLDHVRFFAKSRKECVEWEHQNLG